MDTMFDEALKSKGNTNCQCIKRFPLFMSEIQDIVTMRKTTEEDNTTYPPGCTRSCIADGVEMQ